MIRFLLFTVGIAVVVSLGLLIDTQSQAPASRPSPPSRPVEIFALGRIEGRCPEIELRPELEGRVVEVFVEEGQQVEANEIILQLDDRQYLQQVALAEAELELAEARLDRLVNGSHQQDRLEAAALCRAKEAELRRAQRTWNRIVELRKTNAVSQQKADDQQMAVAAITAELQAAQARLERLQAKARPDEVRIEMAHINAAKAGLELAKVQLQRTQLRAPAAVQVLAINTEIGELTGPEATEPAIIMADTRQLNVRAFIEELDAPRVKIGMTGRIRIDGLPDREFTGRVIRLSPHMSRKQLWSDHPTERLDTKTREVWLELEETQDLLVGLRVDVTLDPGSGTGSSAELARMED